MKQLPSGTRYGVPWPIAAINLLGPLARSAGLSVRIADSFTPSIRGDRIRSKRSIKHMGKGRSLHSF